MSRGEIDLDAAEVRRRLALDPPLKERARRQAIAAFHALRHQFQAKVLEELPPEPFAAASVTRERAHLMAEMKTVLDEALQIECISAMDHTELLTTIWQLDGLDVPSYAPPVGPETPAPTLSVPPPPAAASRTIRPQYDPNLQLLGGDSSYDPDDWGDDWEEAETDLRSNHTRDLTPPWGGADLATDVRTQPSADPRTATPPAAPPAAPPLPPRTDVRDIPIRTSTSGAARLTPEPPSESTGSLIQWPPPSKVPTWIRKLFGDI